MKTNPYGFRIVGPCTGERRCVDWHAAFTAYTLCDERAKVTSEAYLSAFTFSDDFREHLARTGTTKGYAGRCFSPWLWFDIDRDEGSGGIGAALAGTRTLCVNLAERFALADDALLVFYSGSKGFHVGLPTAWKPDPSPDFNRIARRFCENFASGVGVVIDAGVYDQVRAFRAPNSRHPKTGRHKRRLTVDEVMNLDAGAIVNLAETPAPFDLPDADRAGGDFNLAAAWNDAAGQVRAEAEAVTQRRASAAATGGTTARLNRLTLDFIRNGAGTGDRHRLLYSAARNLAEFDCPAALAADLLTEAALDSGLSPSDVRRQIECGLKDGGPRHEG